MEINFDRGEMLYKRIPVDRLGRAGLMHGVPSRGTPQSSGLASLLATLRKQRPKGQLKPGQSIPGDNTGAASAFSAREQLEEIKLSISIKKENRGKFDATKKRTGKSDSELKDSKNALTRKRATFAENAKSWHHGKKKHTDGINDMSAREQLIQLKAIDLGQSYPNYPVGYGCDAGKESRKSYPTLYVGDRDTDIDLPLTGTATVKYKLRSKTIRQDEEGKKRHSADIEIQSIDPVEETKALPGTAKPLKMSARESLDVIRFARGDQAGKVLSAIGIRAGASRNGAEAGKMLSKLGTSYASIQHPAAFRGATRKSFKDSISRVAGSKGAYEDQSRHRDMLAGAIKEWRGRSFSARETLDIIRFGDPRPRNPLGQFEPPEDGAPSPNTVATVYKQPGMGSTVGTNLVAGGALGVGSVAGGGALKALMSKIKKPKI